MLRTLASRLLAPLLVAGLVSAQQLILPSGVLTPGETIDISFVDASQANGTVIITLDNGDSVKPERIDIEIKLDGNGKGSASWTVPDWWEVHANGGGAKEVSRQIEEPAATALNRTGGQ